MADERTSQHQSRSPSKFKNGRSPIPPTRTHHGLCFLASNSVSTSLGTMSDGPMNHASSAPPETLSHSPSATGTEPLSRSSTFSKTIPLPNKVVHVVRNPREGYRLKDVEWVIQGSQKHVSTLIVPVLIVA